MGLETLWEVFQELADAACTGQAEAGGGLEQGCLLRRPLLWSLASLAGLEGTELFPDDEEPCAQCRPREDLKQGSVISACLGAVVYELCEL